MDKKSIIEFGKEVIKLQSESINNISKYIDENFEKAIQIEPNYADAFYNLGNIHKQLRNYQKAINYYKKTIAIN